MERVHPAEQSTQNKGLVSGWSPCLAAKSSLHCSRARSSVSMCNLTPWGDSPFIIYCRSPRCQGKGCNAPREDSLYAILKQGKQTLITLTKSRPARTKKVSPRIWWSVKVVEMFSAKVAHAFSCHGWWEPLSKTEQTQRQRWKSKKDTGFSVLLWFHQLTSWQWLPWWLFSSPTLYWVP